MVAGIGSTRKLFLLICFSIESSIYLAERNYAVQIFVKESFPLEFIETETVELSSFRRRKEVKH